MKHGPGSTRLAALAAAAGLSASACVKDAPEPPKRTVVANWSFPPAKPNPAVRMWPKESTSPGRKKHGIETTSEGTRLIAKIQDGDPYLMWDFQEEVGVASVRLVLHSTHDGPVEMFWTSLKCPVYTQACSKVTGVPAGPATIAFFLDPSQGTRSVRVDLLDKVGETVAFESVDAFTSPEMDIAWAGRAGHVTLEGAPGGLVVQATGDDPWMIVPTPGLVAERVTAIELLMLEAPPGTELPRLFWEGPCGPFAQECSKSIPAVQAKTISHRVELGAADKWAGPIRALRLDPGSASGKYLIKRITLARGNPP